MSCKKCSIYDSGSAEVMWKKLICCFYFWSISLTLCVKCWNTAVNYREEGEQFVLITNMKTVMQLT